MTVINKMDNMTNKSTYENFISKLKLWESMALPDFLNICVFTATQIVKGDGCSIFLRFNQKDDKIILSATTRTQLKKLVGYASYSTKKKYYENAASMRADMLTRTCLTASNRLPTNVKKKMYPYLTEMELGLTGWVAAFNTPLRLKCLSDEKERGKYVKSINKQNNFNIPLPVWSDRYRGFKDSLESERPFLCVPIRAKVEKKYIALGALRIATKRDAIDQNFKLEDETSLQEFADEIGQILWDNKVFNPLSLKLFSIFASTDSDTLLKRIADTVTTVLVNKSCCSIFLKEDYEDYENENKEVRYNLRMAEGGPGEKKYETYLKKFKNEEERKKIFYFSGEGKTGWVIEKSKRIAAFLKGPEEKMYLNNFCNESDRLKEIEEQINSRKKSNKKPCELPLEMDKWFCAVPILSIDNASDVHGVIRVVSLEKITKEQVNMLESFAAQIARIFSDIEHSEALTKLFHQVLGNLGESGNIEQQVFIDAAIKLVDADAASIFLNSPEAPNTYVRVSTMKNFNENQYPNDDQAFSSFSKNNAEYFTGGEKAQGKTGYVLETGKILNLANGTDENELPPGFSKIADNSNKFCEIYNLGAILIVPIYVQNNRHSNGSQIQGVIRFVRIKNSPKGRFDKNDEALATVLSQNYYLISKVAEERERVEKERKKTQENWEQVLETVFTDELFQTLNTIYQDPKNKELSPVFDEINYFLNNYSIHSPFNIAEYVEQTIVKLWEALDLEVERTNNTQVSALFAYFRNYETILYDLPRYRDHFIHQLVVYLIGQAIIDKLGLNSVNPKAWLVAATLHDIAYPIAKASSVYSQVVEKCFGAKISEPKWLDLNELMYGDKSLVNMMELICDTVIEKLKLTKNVKLIGQTRTFFYKQLLRNQDHGILSALTLLSHIEPFQRQESYIKDAIIAIALHNSAFELFKITNRNYLFENLPILVLLLYSDALHEWGRSKELLGSNNTKKDVLLNGMAFRGSKVTARIKINPLTDVKEYIYSNMDKLFKMISSKNPLLCLEIENYGDEGKFKSW